MTSPVWSIIKFFIIHTIMFGDTVDTDKIVLCMQNCASCMCGSAAQKALLVKRVLCELDQHVYVNILLWLSLRSADASCGI